ncbi:MAG: T9SS type A sorting domain-containing protein, partial [Bacteroidetes bacterium]|nr:T9SS type A sorting domain-containing protein [Bacteroidota bacterium]
GFFVRSTDGGTFFSSATNGISSSDRKNWNTPVIFHPNDPTILYYGSNRLYKSTNRASSWNAISPDLTNGPGSGNLVFGTITTISVSPVDDNIIYVGTDDGNVQVTTDGGTNWAASSGLLPNRWITQVVADSQDANIVYVTLSGYRYGSNQGHVFLSVDQGATWTDISGDLPDIPVNDLVIVPQFNYLYIATDIGVFYSKNLGTNWELLGNDLPNVVITDLDYHPPTKMLVAASYGRGLYTTILEEEVAAGISKNVGNNINLKTYPNPFSNSLKIEFVISERGNYSLSIFDLNGREIKRVYQGSLTPGSHEFDIESESFASGIYIAKLEEKGKGLIGQKKLIKN